MAKKTTKKVLENEIRAIEERLSSLNSSLKQVKTTKKAQENTYLDEMMQSTSLISAMSTRIYEEKKILSSINRIEELSIKILDLKTKKQEVQEKEKYLDRASSTVFLLPLYNQILNLKSVVSTVKAEIDKINKEVKKAEKGLEDKKNEKEVADSTFLKVSKDVDKDLDKLSKAFSRYNKTNKDVKELETLIKQRDKLIKEIDNLESEKLDLLFVLENSRVLKEELKKEKDSIAVSKNQIENINTINDIEIEVKILEEKKDAINRQVDEVEKQVDGIKEDIDITKKKIEEIEELQSTLLPSIGNSSDNLYTLIANTDDELNRLTILLAEIKGSIEQKENLTKINETYVYEIEELKQKTRISKLNEDKQKEIIKEIKEEIEQAKKEEDSPSIRKVIKELTNCIDKSNKVVTKLKNDRFEFRTKLDEKKRLLDINYAEIKLINNKIESFRKENGFPTNEDILTKLQIDSERIKLLKAAIDDYYNYDLKKKVLERDLDENYALHHILSIRVSELNTESENISYKVKELREEYQDFIDAFGGMSIKELRNELNENIALSDDLSKKIEGQAMLSLDCNEKLSTLDSKIAQKKLSLASTEDKIDILSKKIDEISTEIKKISNGNMQETKDKLLDKLNKAKINKFTKDDEYNKLKDEYDALLVLINSKKELINKYNEQIDLFSDKLDMGLKEHSFKSSSELKQVALPKKEVDRIRKEVNDYYREIAELEREKQVHLNFVAGKSLDETIIRKDEEALRNINNTINKSAKKYRDAINKNLDAKYSQKAVASIKEEIAYLNQLLNSLKETQKLLEKDN